MGEHMKPRKNLVACLRISRTRCYNDSNCSMRSLAGSEGCRSAAALHFKFLYHIMLHCPPSEGTINFRCTRLWGWTLSRVLTILEITVMNNLSDSLVCGGSPAQHDDVNKWSAGTGQWDCGDDLWWVLEYRRFSGVLVASTLLYLDPV